MQINVTTVIKYFDLGASNFYQVYLKTFETKFKIVVLNALNFKF